MKGPATTGMDKGPTGRWGPTFATCSQPSKHECAHERAHRYMHTGSLSFVDVRFIAYNKNPNNNAPRALFHGCIRTVH